MLIIQRHQTILSLCPVLPQQTHGGEIANLIVRPHKFEKFCIPLAIIIRIYNDVGLLNVKFYNKGFSTVTWTKVFIRFEAPIGNIILHQHH